MYHDSNISLVDSHTKRNCGYDNKNKKKNIPPDLQQPEFYHSGNLLVSSHVVCSLTQHDTLRRWARPQLIKQFLPTQGIPASFNLCETTSQSCLLWQYIIASKIKSNWGEKHFAITTISIEMLFKIQCQMLKYVRNQAFVNHLVKNIGLQKK